MLDRMSMNLVSLPDETYDIILILTDADNTRRESQSLLASQLFTTLVKSLKAGGRLRSQDNSFAATEDSPERREAILAGLIVRDGQMVKPDYASTASVPLRLGKKGSSATTNAAGTGAVSLNLTGKRKNGPLDATQPAGVGFVDFSDDFDAPVEEDDDNELIDEDTLLSDEDLAGPVVQRRWNPPQPLTLLPVHMPLNVPVIFPPPYPRTWLTVLLTSPRMSPQNRQTSTCLQRLHLRPRCSPRCRRRRQTCHRRCGPR